MAGVRRKLQIVQEMEVNKSKTRIIIIVVFFLLFTWGGVSYYNSLTYLRVSFINVQKVDAYNSDNRQSPAYSITKSADDLKLKHGGYYIHAYGSDGYADTYKTVTMTSRHQSIDIKPYYSQAHLDTLLTSELSSIQSTLSNQFDNLPQYQVQKGTLYHFGEWYGTSLKYIGNDLFNADTLHVVLQKTNGQWKVVTTEPSISLSKLTYPDIPRDVIESFNKY